MDRLKAYLTATSSFIALFNLGTLTLIWLIYTTYLGLHLVSVEVQYHSESFVVTKTYKDTAGYQLLVVGDRITKIEGLALPEFFEHGGIAFLGTQPDFPDTPFLIKQYSWPNFPPPNEKVIFFSVGAHTLTVERPQPNNQSVVVDLEQVFANKKTYVVFTLQFLTALVFWLTGFILWVLKPDQRQTLYFNLFFGTGGVYLVAINASSFSPDYRLFFIHAFCCFMISTSFPLLALYFPGGLSKPFTPSFKLGLGFLIVAAFVVNVAYVVFILNQSSLGQGWVKLATTLRLLLLCVSMLGSIAFFLVRSFKSTGLLQMKLRLVCLSLLLSVIPTAIIYIGYYNFGLFDEVVNNYAELLPLPIVFFPLGFMYAILRHRLFYPSLIAREVLAYLILIGMLWVLYVLVVGFVSFFLDVAGFERSWFGVLVFIALALLASRLYSFSRHFIDRVFYRNKLNYHQLLKKWMGHLAVPGANLTELIGVIVQELGKDFQYSNLALLLLEDISEDMRNRDIEFYFETQTPQGPAGVEPSYRLILFEARAPQSDGEEGVGGIQKSNSSQQRAEDYELGLIERLVDERKLELNQVELSIIASYQGFGSASLWSQTTEVNSAGSALTLDLAPATLFGLPELKPYQFFLPFKPFDGHNIVGGVLFGPKLAGKPPSQEEQLILNEIVNQLALSINSAVLVQLEKARRQLIQAFVVQQDALADRSRQRLSREIHDTVAQDYNFINARLATWLSRFGEEASLHSELIQQAYEVSRSFHTKLRTLVRQLSASPIESTLVAALEDLTVEFTLRFDPKQITFHSQLSVEQEQSFEAFPEDVRLEIYRIVQEAIANALNHANCNRVKVCLYSETHSGSAEGAEEAFILEVRDDGKGFRANELRLTDLMTSGHYGLVFMHQRASIVGGRLTLKNGAVNGAIVQLHIPASKSKGLNSRLVS